MADLSASYDLGAIATSSDAASDAASKAVVAQSTGSDASSAASVALAKAAAASSVIATNLGSSAGPTFDHIHLGVEAILHSHPKGANMDGKNFFVGGGGQNCVGAPGQTHLGSDNLGLGDGALATNTTGYCCTALGNSVLTLNTTGYYNVGVGCFALSKNDDGNENTAIGEGSMELLAAGSENTALGRASLTNNLSGSYNTAIGAYSLWTMPSGNGCVALGWCAGYYETGANKLFIDNHYRASEADARVKALIYGIFAAATVNQYLSVNAHLKIPAGQYFNWGTDFGSGGYGLRDNTGAVEYKDSGGAWTPLNTLGGGAPTTAQYVCLAVDAGLSAERVLTAGTGITLTDAGANGAVTLAANIPSVVSRHCWIHETFDDLATGSIIGLGSYFEMGAWADDTIGAGGSAEVVVKDGADKMLRIQSLSATSSYISSTTTTSIGLSGGWRLHFKMRIDQNTAGYVGGVGVYLADNTEVFLVYFRYSTTFQITAWNGSSALKLQNANKDQWYTIDVFFGSDASGPSAVFVDGTFRGRQAFGAMSANWTKMRVKATSPAAGATVNFDVDDLYFYSLFPLGLD